MTDNPNQTRDRTPIVKDRAALNAERTVENQIEADRLVDETGATIEVPPEEIPVNATHGEPSVGATGPTNWWRTGLLLIGIIFVIYIAISVLAGAGSG